MRGCGNSCGHAVWNLWCERGGGSKPQPPTFITPPPPQITQAPPPNIQQNAEDLFKAQLQYNPQLTAQATQLQQQYGPQLAESATDIQTQQAPKLAQSQYALQQQYGPLYKSLYEQLFPTQVQGQERLAQQSLQRLQSPQGLTPEQQSYQDVVRNREQQRFLQGIRTQANLGGTLYGGQREQREQEGLAELAGQYSQQDLALEQQRRSQTLQELIASSQVVFPQVQQPGVQPGQAAQFGQSVTPSADALLQAIMQGQIVTPAAFSPGVPGTPGQGGQIAGAVGGTMLTAKLMFVCLPGTTLIDTDEGQKPIRDVTVKDTIGGATILILQSYAAMSTIFVKLTLADGRWVETCDVHEIEGKPAISYHEGNRLSGQLITSTVVETRTEPTYDLFTLRSDGGYSCQGIAVASMIPKMHRFAQHLQEIA